VKQATLTTAGFTLESRTDFWYWYMNMMIIILVLIFLFVVACATVRFQESLKRPGAFFKKLWQWITDVFDALLGIG
jgi:hypothetical protein